jgi:N-acetylglucosaminyl-diphospho-decaprenol L-rhamnosyltransferase
VPVELTSPLEVVLVHRRQPERLAATIDRLRSLEVPVSITVVDNGSPAPDLAAVARLAPEHLLELGHNAGFGPGANAGMRRWLEDDVGDWVAVAPHDALVEHGCLRALLEAAAAHPRAGLLCADVGDGQVPVVDPYFGGITRPASTSAGWEPADHPHGTLLLARRACLEDVGLFDERYFAYCEEADLGVRARAHGWEVGIVHGARVRNTTVGSSTAVVDYLQLRNTLLLVREHSGRYHAAVRTVIAALQLVSGVVRPRSKPLVFHPRARLLAVRDHWRGRYGPPPASLQR